MVCLRCKIMVQEELKKLGLNYESLDIGEVKIIGNISHVQREQFKIALSKIGLELIDDKKDILIEKIKNIAIEFIHYTGEPSKIKFSDYISQKLKYDYTYLANLFSEIEGTTIEHFIIIHKIEMIKEFIIYNELSITQIAWKLNYSSVSALTNQFKKVTGLTPSFFKYIMQKRYVF